MPFAQIEVRRRWSDEEQTAISEAVHEALVAAFRIPPADKNVRLIEHLPHRFAPSPSLSQPEYRTLVTIDCFAGRSIDAKRKLYGEIVERLEVFGIPRDHVSILLRDSPAENWGIQGGQAASDIELGFDVNV